MSEPSRIKRTKSSNEISAQAVRISQLARETGDWDRFDQGMEIAAKYRENIRKTRAFNRGEWINGRYTGGDMRFNRSVYARRNNRS